MSIGAVGALHLQTLPYLCHNMKYDYWEKHATLRAVRADFARIKATLQGLGGMYVTDFVHAVSYLTPEEIIEMAGKGRDAQDARVASTPRCW